MSLNLDCFLTSDVQTSLKDSRVGLSQQGVTGQKNRWEVKNPHFITERTPLP